MRKNFEDIVIEITDRGDVRIDTWPDYDMDSAELIRKLRMVADNVEKIKQDAGGF